MPFNKELYQNLGLNCERSPYRLYVDAPLNLLVEKTIAMKQGHLTNRGALAVTTGQHTGRSAKDKYVVESERSRDKVWWDNNLGKMSAQNFQTLKQKVLAHFNEPRDLFVIQRSVGARPEHNLGVRLISTHPQHALFGKYLFRPPIHPAEASDFTIYHAPELSISPEEFGVRSGTVIATCFETNATIIVGTLYAGEIKKSMFCVMNYLLPDRDILPMHAGANRLQNGETSIFFGLSGTGKTTLATDQGTLLIGDDEHGMDDQGVFNFEGGCYAKTFKLSRQAEPEIWRATNHFGAMMENVVVTEKTGEPDFFDDSISENGRSSYPLDFVEEVEPSSQGKIPNHIFFLCADAFGVLPPVSQLTLDQAMFYFVAGYTAKVAGTEIGIVQPHATFSACFGGPFMLRHPSVYAELLGRYLDKHKINVWLINTGWTGGPYGEGNRFPLNITRNIIRTIQSGALNISPKKRDPIFGLNVPIAVRNVPTSLLNPQETWRDKEAYTVKAQELAASFHQQMRKFDELYQKISSGGPSYSG